MTEMTREQIVEARRAGFEVRIVEKFNGDTDMIQRDEFGEYYSVGVAEDWEEFNTAVDSIEIELPEKMLPAADDDVRWHSLRNSTIDACRRAIEAQGLKVKP